MKQILSIFAVLLLFYASVNAQTFSFHRVSAPIVVQDTSSYFPAVTKGVFKNLSTTVQSFKFVRVVNNLPGSWSSQMCVGQSCYPPFVDTCPPTGGDPITLAPNASDTIYIDVFGMTAGTATIVIKAFVLSAPTTFLTDTFKVQLVYTGIRQISSIVEDYSLNQNYPNPFNPTTLINFTLPKEETVSLKVYNILGMEVADLLNYQKLQGGRYSFVFNANEYNLSSGVYIYKLVTNDIVLSKKMILAK